MKKIAAFTAALVAMAGLSTAQVTLFSEDFESYADTAAMEAVWTASQPGVITLTEDIGNGAEGSNKFITVPSGTAGTLGRTYTASAAITDDENVTLTAYLRGASWANSRASVNMRDAPASAALYISVGNNNATGDNKWAYRVLGYTPNPDAVGYVIQTAAPDRPVDTWVKLQAECGATYVDPIIDDVTYDRIDATAPALTFGYIQVGYGNTPNQDYNADSFSIVQAEAASVSDWDLMF